MRMEGSVFSVLILLNIFASVSGQSIEEKMALLQFKKSIFDPSGILKSWINADSSNHCSWFGVSCNSKFRISKLKIEGNLSLSPSCSLNSEYTLHAFGIKRNCSVMNGKLVGKISPALGNLTQLEVLSLPFNEFDGEIPVEIWRLKNLQVLDFEGNLIAGKFSGYEFTSLRKLRILNLAFNRISGQFPLSLSKCRYLTLLNLAGNEINDVIPGYVGDLRKLRVVNLSFNWLVGSIPSNLGYDCGNLEHLDLSVNFLKGDIPHALGNCSHLRTLLLSSNGLYGAIPHELGRILSLKVLDVSRNNLRGPLPTNLGNCINLSVLVLSSHFNIRYPCGEAPSPGLPGPAALDDYNSFEGSIPDEITTLPKLEIIWAPGANFEGKFPSNWESCKSLKMVNLAQNFFTGEILDLLDRCNDLQYLNLSSNKLTGRLDENVMVSCIKVFDISHNLFSGPIPDFTTNVCQTKLGKIPIYRGSLAKMTSFNDLSGTKVVSLSLKSEAHAPYKSEQKSKASNELSLVLVSVISALLVTLILLALIAFFCYTRKMKKQNSRIEMVTSPQTNKVTIFNNIGVQLTYESIIQATRNFNQSNCIGNGGFGSTYKAEISPENTVAVKRLTAERQQGAPQFHAEVSILGKIKHPNLITLIGYFASDAEMFLIYNYLPGGNLNRFIRERERRAFNWNILHKICLNIASALDYLHDKCSPRVLHRDIKPSNILLDNDYNAYLSDFGLSKILSTNETHATTRVAGTYGYIAPEYALTGRVSYKADVYSYGVVLLELMSDKRALDPSFYSHEDGFDIVCWARMIYGQGEVKDFFTASLWDSGPQDKLVKMLHLAISCTNESLSDRPMMSQVVCRLKHLELPTGEIGQ